MRGVQVGKDLTELEILLNNAKQQLGKAQKQLSVLTSHNETYKDTVGVIAGLDAITNYLSHVDEIVDWVKNSLE